LCSIISQSAKDVYIHYFDKTSTGKYKLNTKTSYKILKGVIIFSNIVLKNQELPKDVEEKIKKKL